MDMKISAILVRNEIEHKIPQEVIDRCAKVMHEAAEKQLTDAINYGHGYVKQTNYPFKTEHVPYMSVVIIDNAV